MKEKNSDNLGCLFSFFVVFVIMAIPNILVLAFVVQKLSFWFFGYTNDFMVFAGIVLLASFLNSHDEEQKEGETANEYLIRMFSKALMNTIFKPALYLFFGYVIYMFLK